MNNSLTTGYDLLNIKTGEKEAFLRQNEECGNEKIGRFTICRKGLAMGISILSSLISPRNGIVIIDEVGLLELGNKGWSDCINNLLRQPGNHILLIVRDTYIEKVKEKWALEKAVIFNIKETDYYKAGVSVLELVDPQ